MDLDQDISQLEAANGVPIAVKQHSGETERKFT
jgi:hypothetical protein